MASLSTLIDARTKAPSTKITFNGNTTRDILSVSVNMQLDGGISSASIKTLSNPSTTPEARVLIRQGYNGNNQLTFTGYIDSIERNESDDTFTITCRDVLKKALDTFLVQEVKFGQDLAKQLFYYSTYTSNDGGTFTVHEYNSLAALNAAHPETSGNYSSQGVKAEAVVQWLLHMSGLAEGTEIQVDSTNFWIGDLNPAKFHMSSVYDAAMQIANLIGWRIYADAAGVARFKRKPRQPGGYTYWRYTDKAEPYNIHRLAKTSSNIDLRNYVEVRGASGIRVVKRASSPYIGNTPYRGVLISEELIDTPGIAEFMATRVLNDLNRLKITITMDVDGNPLLTPGSTVDILANTAQGKFLVETYQTNMSADAGYKGSITGAAYLGDSVMEEDLTADITAAFVPTFVSILGDPKYIVEFDAATSYSSQGVITNYYWQWPNGSTYSSSDSTSTFVFDSDNIDDGRSQNVILTVTDALGNTGSVTKAITGSGLAAAIDVKYRHLYAALTTRAAGSIDGGQSWTTNSIPAVSVAASNFAPGGVFVPSGHALFGTSDGKIYKTNDVCNNVTLVLSPGGEVTDIHIPEMDSTKAMAVTSTGKVYYSDTSGDSWTQVGSFAFPLRQVKMGFTDFKYAEIVGSGSGKVYETFDTGGHWAKLSTTLNVLWATDGASSNYFAHTAGVYDATAGSAISGVTIAVPAATVMIDRNDGVMAVDSAGQHWVASSGVFTATQNSSNNLTRHMIRDGEMALVTYFATQSGVSKSIDRNTTMETLYAPIGSMPTGGWGKKVAYGPLAAINVPGQLVFRGSHNSSSKWWIASASGWVVGAPNVGGVAAITTAGIAVAKTTSNKIDYIQCIGSGGVTGGITQMVTHTDWIETEGTILSFSFSNKAGARDQLCMTSYGTVDGERHHYAETVPDFKNAEGDAPELIVLQNGDFRRSSNGTKTTSLQGEMLSSMNYTFFSPAEVYSVVYAVDGSMTASHANSGATSPGFAAFHKASTAYKAVRVRLESDGGDHLEPGLCPGELTSGSVSTVEEYEEPYPGSPNVLIPEFVIGGSVFDQPYYEPMMYGSCVDQSRIYYAWDGNGTDGGVSYADAYGFGVRNLILDQNIVASGQIKWLGVTYSNDNTTDYLCAIIRQGGTDDSYIFYSNDSGQTWYRSPKVVGNQGGGEAYFIDLS